MYLAHKIDNEWMTSITYFAETDFRGVRTQFGIKQPDRLFHTYMIGKTGTGKTTLLDTMIRQDILAGHGCCLLDPHGDLVSSLISFIPPERQQDLIYLDLTDSQQPWGYNPLGKVSVEKRSLVCAGTMEVFRKLWGEKAWGVKMEHILRNSLLTLLEQPHATLEDIPRILTDAKYRKEALKHLDNVAVSDFWTKEYEAYSKASRTEAISPVLNKVGGFLTNKGLRRFLVESDKPLRLRQVMDSQKILLINLSQGEIGRDASLLCGALLLTSLGLAGFSRANIPEQKRKPYYIYADEFQNFSTLSLASMLSELRKYKVGLIAANQYLDQLEKEIRDAVLGNVGTIMSFRVSPNDAKYMAREFSPVFTETDMVNLPNYHFYLKLMIDGTPSKSFSAKGLGFRNIV